MAPSATLGAIPATVGRTRETTMRAIAYIIRELVIHVAGHAAAHDLGLE